MKIRNGFVSNSSSSSFILLTSCQNHNQVISELTNQEQEIINSIISKDTKILFGKDIVFAEISECSDYSTFVEVAEKLNLEYLDIATVWDKYETKLKENKEEVFTYMVNL